MPGRPLPIPVPQDQLALLCRRYRVSRLSFFGSILRQDFGPQSDIDVLVEFLPGQTPGYLELGGLLVELSALLGRRVDLHTPKTISEFFRDRVLREAHVQYAA